MFFQSISEFVAKRFVNRIIKKGNVYSIVVLVKESFILLIAKYENVIIEVKIKNKEVIFSLNKGKRNKLIIEILNKKETLFFIYYLIYFI